MQYGLASKERYIKRLEIVQILQNNKEWVLRLCKRSAEKPKATAECIFGLKETGYITIPKQYCAVCRNAVSIDYWRFVRHSIVAYKTRTEQSVNLGFKNNQGR